jgi:hypothetical protein
MSRRDALGGLLDRARGAIPQLRPALAPRFGPPGVVQGESAAESDPAAYSQTNEWPPMHRMAPDASSFAARTPPEDPFADTNRHDPRERISHESDASRSGVRPPAPVHDLSAESGHESTPPARTVEPEYRAAAVVPSPRNSDEPVPRPSRSEARAEPRMNMREPLPGATAQQSERALRSPEHRPAQRVEQAVSKASQGIAPQRIGQPKTSVILPGVQVSIGRVEVRAIPRRTAPVPTPAPPKPASPALSLHAFLQRSRGGRS